MVTEKVAGRVREHPPAVMFPENLSEPESHAVNVPRSTLPSNDARIASARARRWNRRPTTTATDVLAATFLVLGIVGGIALVCVALMLAAPR